MNRDRMLALAATLGIVTGPARYVVMVTGAVPGLGKSALCRTLSATLGKDHRVELFSEEDIGFRPEFAEVVDTFLSGGTPTVAQLLDAAAAYAAACQRTDATVFVQDMLLPYLPSLLAWGYPDEDIAAFLSELAVRCGGIRLLEIHLVGDPRRAVLRAATREDPPWLDRLIRKVGGYQDVRAPVTDLASLVEHLQDAQERSRRLLRHAPWPCRVIDADLVEAAVATDALRTVATWIEPTP